MEEDKNIEGSEKSKGNDVVNKGKEAFAKVTEKLASDKVPLWKIVVEFLGLVLIFGYNIYVIFNNFSAGVGYIWAILAIIIDLGIIVSAKELLGVILERKFKKVNKYLLYIPFIVLILIIAPVSCDSPAKKVARTAPALVNTILENNFGGYVYAKCTKVKITDCVIKDTLYYGYAILENGNKLSIGMTYSKANNQVYVELLD